MSIEEAILLPKGAEVWYDGREGRVVAKIVKVHYDDIPPYYTISIGSILRKICYYSKLARAAAPSRQFDLNHV